MGIDKPRNRVKQKRSKESTAKAPDTTKSPAQLKQERELGENVSVQRSRMLGGLAALGLIGGLLIYAAKSNSEDRRYNQPQKVQTQTKPESARISRLRPTPISQVKLTGQPHEQLIQMQEYWKDISENALGMFKNADPRAASLREFMQKNAFYSLPIGPQTTEHIKKGSAAEILNTSNNPDEFEIVFMPEAYARQMPSAIITEDGGRTIRIADSAPGPLYRR